MDLFEFNDVQPEDDLDEQPENKSEKATSMPLILAALDSNDFSYYEKFGKNEEERLKNWSGESYQSLRWLSCVGNSEVDWAEAKRQNRKKGDKKGAWPSTLHDNELTPYYLIATNEIVNIKFWDLGNHKKLLFLLLACVGQGQASGKSGHNWPGMPKKRKGNNEFEEILLKLYPNANSLELKLLTEKYKNEEKFKNLCKSMGYSDEQIKKISTVK